MKKAVQKNFASNAQFLEIALQRKAKSSRQDFTQSPQRRNEARENLRSLRKLLCIVVRMDTKKKMKISTTDYRYVVCEMEDFRIRHFGLGLFTVGRIGLCRSAT